MQKSEISWKNSFFEYIYEKTTLFLPTEPFYCTNAFTEKKEDFPEQSFSEKTNEIDGK